jgi:hypothetical protein
MKRFHRIELRNREVIFVDLNNVSRIEERVDADGLYYRVYVLNESKFNITLSEWEKLQAAYEASAESSNSCLLKRIEELESKLDALTNRVNVTRILGAAEQSLK